MSFDWRIWSPGQWALRAVVLLGPVLALVARGPSLGAPKPWVVGVVLLLGVGWALTPESFVGCVVLLVVGFSWVSAHEAEVPVGALVAAFGLLAAHLAALVVSYGPSQLPINAGVVRLWIVRGVMLLAAAPVVWALARTVDGLPASGSVWVAGLVVAVSVVVVATAATRALNPLGES